MHKIVVTYFFNLVPNWLVNENHLADDEFEQTSKWFVYGGLGRFRHRPTGLIAHQFAGIIAHQFGQL